MPLDTLGAALRCVQVPTWLLKNFLVAERSCGNLSGPPGTAIKVQSIDLDALSAFGYFGALGAALRCVHVPTLLLKNFLVAERSCGNRSGPPGTAIKVQSIDLEALSAFGYFGALGAALRSVQVPTWLLKNF